MQSRTIVPVWDLYLVAIWINPEQAAALAQELGFVLLLPGFEPISSIIYYLVKLNLFQM